MWKNCAVHRPSNLVMQGLWMAVPYWLMFKCVPQRCDCDTARQRCHGYKSALTENLYQRQERQTSRRTVLSQAAQPLCCTLLFIKRRYTYTHMCTIVGSPFTAMHWCTPLYSYLSFHPHQHRLKALGADIQLNSSTSLCFVDSSDRPVSCFPPGRPAEPLPTKWRSAFWIQPVINGCWILIHIVNLTGLHCQS